ncbi:hypothetical protein BGX27_005672 [Mortierella sp. AM989]|nr:hypothetical protein BGX27_005672 [Mortierella sp. AM989]
MKPVIIKSHPIEALCPVKAYVEYRRQTCAEDRYARTSHPKVGTISFTPLVRQLRLHNLRLGSERIQHYIQEIMKFAPREEGTPKYKARAVGATMALKKGVTVDDVTFQGNWSSPAIVNQFYRISRSVKNNFTTAIFS